jgi:hypothetical protein
VLHHFLDRNSGLHISIQHRAYQIDTVFAHDIWNAQIAVHDLVDAVEWILLVDDGVQQDTECPYVLLFAAVRLAGENFGGGVIC